MGTVPRNSRWDVGDYIPPIFCKYSYKMTVFSNAYLRHVVMLRWDGSVCRLSVKRVGLYDEKTAPVSTSTKCFVVVSLKKF